MVKEMTTWIAVTEEPLDVTQLTSSVYDPTAGAVATFLGTTRNHAKIQGCTRQVKQLEYEAYVPMAERQLHLLVIQVRKQYPSLCHITVHHRTGVCAVGEVSVLVAVSSPHRADALAAVQFLIDELKMTVPIWKREVYVDGDALWKQNCSHS